MHRLLLAGLGWTLIAANGIASAQALRCDMAPAFVFKGESKATTVHADRSAGALLFATGLQINTDGTRRSYRVDDFWGARVALNNLCNAMSDRCAGLDEPGLRARRLATERAAHDGWPAGWMAATRIDTQIVAVRQGKPCTTSDGYLVSATALQRADVADVCSLEKYVDALRTPALVLPGRPSKGVASQFEERNARKGDLAVAVRPGAAAPVFSVVGDTGPRDKLGEGSIALNGALLGLTHEPASYRELRGRDEFRGRGWSVPSAVVLIFTASRDDAAPWMTRERIDAEAGRRFASWGGMARLNACIAELRLGPRE